MTRDRIARVQHELQKRGLDGMLVSSLHAIRYLTGFTGTHALLLLSSSTSTLLTDSRYAQQAKMEARGCKRVIVTRNGLYEEASRRRMLDKLARVGFEAQHVSYAQYRMLRTLFPGVSFASTRELVEDVMVVKDEEEINNLRRAAHISDRVFEKILDIIRPGITELEVAAEISYLHRTMGAERDAFDTIVASGTRSALPHARASLKRVRNGELLTLDFGCVVNGYNSDITRTIAVGRPARRARRMYEAVRAAQQEALESARGGMLARDLDAVARLRIARAGFGKLFHHSLGHGLGLHVHERPRVSRLSKERLMAGSVITIEPGIYLPDFGGVRIEDDVVLRENGCEVLNSAPKDFIVV